MIGKDAALLQNYYSERVFGPAQVTKEILLGQFRDPEGHLIGLMEASA